MPGQDIEDMLRGRCRLTRLMEELRMLNSKRSSTMGQTYGKMQEIVRELAEVLPGFEDMR